MSGKETVFVGLSGGVDSSVAACRLIEEGYTVVGVFIKVWHPDFLVCNWEAERLDAMRVAAHLGIPFLTCDAVDAYKDDVADYFIASYKAGRTPNPDVMCNQFVKFGAFLDFAKERGVDKIATGHYAQNIHTDAGYNLVRGVDGNKDQSYFLWTLTQDQLSHVLLPVGRSTKDSIRSEAAAAGIPTATKKDSQGVCFLGHIDIPDFLSHYIDLEPGDVVDESGEVIGLHQGVFVYTIGQRHGFIISSHESARLPHYVVAKDVAKNTVTVSVTPPVSNVGDTICLYATNWIPHAPTKKTYTAQSRYRQTPFAVEVVSNAEDSASLRVLGQTESPAVGQSCVLYDGENCIGGGMIG